ncbi:MAG: acetylglutamate kinase [Oscillospiraceae bacterium]|nr:acetylglutamate kinase [Oscillospiraceae bacterium]
MNQKRNTELKECMRLVWLQHVYWTRLLLISIAEKLDDQSDTAARLLQNPKDIACIFKKYFPHDCACEVERLLTEHLNIGAELITALRDGSKNADELDKSWYINAEKMAKALHCMNPCYEFCEWKKMLFTHLDLTKTEVAARLAKKYKKDIEAFAAVEKEAISMADMLTCGIVKCCNL